MGAGAADKGTAVAQLITRHGLRGLVVLGDDVTDLDMFRAAGEARARGELMRPSWPWQAATRCPGGGGGRRRRPA